MSSPPRKRSFKGGKKIRVAFRSNRLKPPRKRDWTRQVNQGGDHEIDARQAENIVAKGDLSRHRTVTVPDGDDADRKGLRRGTVIAMRGLYAEVEDSGRIWVCTIRRVLRTRLITERHPVTVGDHVRFLVESRTGRHAREGVIEIVDPRRGELKRHVGRRTQTIVANVDRAVIVSSADQPAPKPHLIDRYIVASLAGDIEPVICMNKMDLDSEGRADTILERYVAVGLVTVATSIVTGEGIEALRGVLKDKASVIAGQSGVGKSSLLNVVQPGLELRVGDIIEQTQKGRHTTSTAGLIRLHVGGYVVDTPGIRSFDLSVVGRREFELYFTEFVKHVPDCKFPDCAHTHEGNCAVKQAVERGEIHPQRYESYLRMYEERG